MTIQSIVENTINEIKSAINKVNKDGDFATLPRIIMFKLHNEDMDLEFDIYLNNQNETKDIKENNGMANKQMKKHSDAKQDKKLINKIVDKKIAKATRADKRSDAKMIQKVVKKPRR